MENEQTSVQEVPSNVTYEFLFSKSTTEIENIVAKLSLEQLDALFEEVSLRKSANPNVVVSILLGLYRNKDPRVKASASKLNAMIVLPDEISGPVRSARDAAQKELEMSDRIRAGTQAELLARSGRALVRLNADDAETAGLENAAEIALRGVENVLQDTRIQSLKVSDLLAIRNMQDAQQFATVKSLEFGENQQRALLFVALVCQRHLPAVQQSLRQKLGSEVENITVRDFFESFSKLSDYYERFASQFREKVSGKSWSEISPEDMQDSLESAFRFDLNDLLQKESRLGGALESLGLQENERGAFALYYPVAKNISLNLLRQGTFRPPILFEGKSIDAQTYKRFEEILIKMQDFVVNRSLHYVELYTHDVKKPGGEKYGKKIEEYLKSPEVSAGDIVDLYIGIQLAEQLTPTDAVPPTLDNATANGGLLMQMKVLQLLNAIDPDYGNAFKGFLMAEAVQAAAGSPSKLRLPPQVSEAVAQVARLADGVVQDLSPVEWADKQAWNLANLVSGSTSSWPEWAQLPPEPIYYLIIAGLGAKVIDWFNAGLGHVLSARYKVENLRLEQGGSVSTDYAALKYPSIARRIMRRIVPVYGSFDQATVEKRKNEMLKSYAEMEQVLGRPLNRQQIDRIVQVRKLHASTPKTNVELQAMLTADGVFTEADATKLSQSTVLKSVPSASRPRATGPVGTPNLDPSAAADQQAELGAVDLRGGDPKAQGDTSGQSPTPKPKGRK